jgi:hypothetical protein
VEAGAGDDAGQGPPPADLITAIEAATRVPFYILDLGYGRGWVPAYAIRYITVAAKAVLWTGAAVAVARGDAVR